MGCVPCAAKARLRNQQYEWTDGSNVIVYPTEAAAKTKVRKRGGTYRIATPSVI
ncbi:hypothetical protein [Aeromicrobium sp.]|uniref:hypothetical protein n=1 Tax=Aeromicrobium sp. TaxID=1871063 RepID=UPI0019B65D9A|nr:hypothetical protein [Aeromicrobium sp.]MBC7630313.1 hypothetical protein [Aeromicrobium sp.]